MASCAASWCAPSAGFNGTLAKLPAGDGLLHFGGTLMPSWERSAETWRWTNAEGWTPVQAGLAPSARALSVMALDVARNRIILLGGYGSGFLDDTWVFDGVGWRELILTVRPLARHSHAMCFDAATGAIIIFGGDGNQGLLDDTWLLDGSGWRASFSSPTRILSAC